MNQIVLTGILVERDAMRYTPAGLPALGFRLEHSSVVHDVHTQRKVEVSVKSRAFGAVAERLAVQPLGSNWRFTGFLVNGRQAKSLVFQVQEFVQDELRN
jgi:primosomal replication protein N